MEPTQTEPTPQQSSSITDRGPQSSQTTVSKPTSPTPSSAPDTPRPPSASSAPSDIRTYYTATHTTLHADLLRTIDTAQRAAHDALATWQRGAWVLRDARGFAALEQAVPGAFEELGAELGSRLAAVFERLVERAVKDERERAWLRARVGVLLAGQRDEFQRRVEEAEVQRVRGKLEESVRALEARLAATQDALAAEQAARTAAERDLADAKGRIAAQEEKIEEHAKDAERTKVAEGRAAFLERALADSQKAVWVMMGERAGEAKRRREEEEARKREEAERKETEDAQRALADEATRRAEKEREARGLPDAGAELAMYLRQRDNVKAERAREIAALEAQSATTLKKEKAKARRAQERKHTAALAECRAQHEAEVQDLKAELGALEDALEERRYDRERYEKEKVAHKRTAERVETYRKQIEVQADNWTKERNVWDRVRKDLERRLRVQQQSSASALDVHKAQHRYAYDLVWNLQHGTLSFSKIPWPVSLPPKSPGELTEGAIRAYLLDPLASADAGSGPKKRIKDALLIFHPDKFEKFWSRMEERDREMVKLGVDMVSKSLTRILAEVGR